MEGADGEHARQSGTGDLITSEIEVENNQGVVTKITKLGTAKPDMPAPGAPAKPGVKFLMPGDVVPNQAFVDQEGRKRDFTSLQGARAMAVTFIYTKCPVPTFCPMMDRQFAEAQTLIKEKGLADTAHLLSVSFDPKNDTPAVLKNHARKLEFDPAIWTFVTGEREEIDRFATNFGVTLVRGEATNPDEIGHTLRTALIGRDGRLVKTYGGGDWTPARAHRRSGTASLTFTPAERRLIARLNTPSKVQRYLNALPYNTEPPPGVPRCEAFAEW